MFQIRHAIKDSKQSMIAKAISEFDSMDFERFIWSQ